MEAKSTSVDKYLRVKVLQNNIAIKMMKLQKTQIENQNEIQRINYNICKNKIFYLNQMNELLTYAISSQVFTNDTNAEIQRLTNEINKLDDNTRANSILQEIEKIKKKLNNLYMQFNIKNNQIPKEMVVVNTTQKVNF